VLTLAKPRIRADGCADIACSQDVDEVLGTHRFTEPAGQARQRVEAAFDDARAFISDFAPELVVIFGPDHYNGFFYDMMPSFCVRAAAESIGDYDTPAGPLPVDHDAALALTQAVLDAEVDVTISERMYVDHGFAQPLQVLLGGIDAVPVVPVFIVPPAGGALIVNIGEMLEVATHGYLVATPHRVLPCAPGGTRDSIAFFWAPRLDASLGTVPLPHQYAEQAPGVSESAHNVLHSRFGDNALKGWLRSPPEVAATHHADLLAQSHTTDGSS
jgi:Catalytic LigB subunit of aromatic ring-opening dioxygenase/2OG-Fe(II) oxygenase superfamily